VEFVSFLNLIQRLSSNQKRVLNIFKPNFELV
jgi:hypothetical protein